MTRARTVLVVDDSPLLRTIVVETLSSVDGLSVIGQAATGVDAIRQAKTLKPDLISLDIELPDISGLDVLQEMLPSDSCRVVVVSSHTEAGADITLRALELGAVDFVAKGRLSSGPDGFETRLARVFGGVIRDLPLDKANRPKQARTRHPKAAVRIPGIVILACSTGGPVALGQFLGTFNVAPDIPFVIVQHMPRSFTPRLAARLDCLGPIRVREAESEETLRPGTALLAPGGMHLDVDRTAVRWNDSESIGALKPRADITLTTAAESWRERTLAIVLPGMGDDGCVGCHAVVQAGGQVLAQDAASSTVDGMPRHVREAGLADIEGTPAQLAAAVEATLRAGPQIRQPASESGGVNREALA